MLYEKGYTTGYHKGKEIMFRDVIEWLEDNKDKDMYCNSYGTTEIDWLINGLKEKFEG